jgi:hypothetical protein
MPNVESKETAVRASAEQQEPQVNVVWGFAPEARNQLI